MQKLRGGRAFQKQIGQLWKILCIGVHANLSEIYKWNEMKNIKNNDWIEMSLYCRGLCHIGRDKGPVLCV